MQDFIDQAAKNGVALLDTGICQFCGADYQRGIYECMENYNNGLLYFNFSDIDNHLYRFLSVDAHALQHPPYRVAVAVIDSPFAGTVAQAEDFIAGRKISHAQFAEHRDRRQAQASEQAQGGGA